jgi:hypothetical protein
MIRILNEGKFLPHQRRGGNTTFTGLAFQPDSNVGSLHRQVPAKTQTRVATEDLRNTPATRSVNQTQVFLFAGSGIDVVTWYHSAVRLENLTYR